MKNGKDKRKESRSCYIGIKMIMSTARDFIKPEMISEYNVLIQKLIEETRKEEGNLSYTHYEDISDSGKYILLEFWKDAKSLEMHFQTPHFKHLVPQIKKLQYQPSQVDTFKEVTNG
ncbi:MAG: putative quinol monooxygenase [Lachnospiraceae bacterium]|nr:putative quinol monooxygenase [Lachnospiraceae bacterium]